MNQIPYLQAKDENTLQVFIDDEIGFWGVTAQDVINNIKESGAKNIELRINSVGGSVTDALAIYNYLKDHKGIITVKVDGLAASAATVIAQAANKGRRYTAESAMWMVHEVSMGAWGKKAEIEEQLKALDVANASIRSIYSANGISEETINNMFDGGDHWFTGSDAIEMGFADKTYNASSKAQARAYAIAASAKEIPEEVKNQIQSNIMAEEKSFFAKVGEFFNNIGKGDYSLEDAKKEVENLKSVYEQEKEAQESEKAELENKVQELETAKENAVNEAKAESEKQVSELTAKVENLEKELAEAKSAIPTNKKAEDNSPETKPNTEMSAREKALEENAMAIREELKNRI